jgi:hypothetical protein
MDTTALQVHQFVSYVIIHVQCVVLRILITVCIVTHIPTEYSILITANANVWGAIMMMVLTNYAYLVIYHVGPV